LNLLRPLRWIRAQPDTWWTDAGLGVVSGAIAGSTDAVYKGQAIAPHAVFGAVWFAVMLPIVGSWRRRRRARRDAAGP
jgi:hypothetical protein